MTTIAIHTTTNQVRTGILALVTDHPNAVGRMAAARIVGGFDVPERAQLAVPRFASYAMPIVGLDRRGIVNVIDAMIAEGVLFQSSGAWPTLSRTPFVVQQQAVERSIARNLIIAVAVAAVAIVVFMLAPSHVLAGPTVVSSSAQEVPDATGDAAPGADLTAFALSTDAKLVHFVWTFAPSVNTRDQQLSVCAVGHARVMCVDNEHANRVRIGNRLVKARVRRAAHTVRVSIVATALGYPATPTRTVRFRAKTGLMLSACPVRCTDFSPLAIAGYTG